jgi:N-glycosylase/DNA lyase
MHIAKSIQMTTLGALRGWEEVRQENYIVCRISSICFLIVYRRRESSVAALAEVLACDQLLMRGEDLIKGFADEFEGKKVRDTAVGEYCDLEFDRKEIPRGGRWNRGKFSDTKITSALTQPCSSKSSE